MLCIPGSPTNSTLSLTDHGLVPFPTFSGFDVSTSSYHHPFRNQRMASQAPYQTHAHTHTLTHTHIRNMANAHALPHHRCRPFNPILCQIGSQYHSSNAVFHHALGHVRPAVETPLDECCGCFRTRSAWGMKLLPSREVFCPLFGPKNWSTLPDHIARLFVSCDFARLDPAPSSSFSSNPPPGR